MTAAVAAPRRRDAEAYLCCWRTGEGVQFGEQVRGLGRADPLEGLQGLPQQDRRRRHAAHQPSGLSAAPAATVVPDATQETRGPGADGAHWPAVAQAAEAIRGRAMNR
jgi:hypothetical protein